MKRFLNGYPDLTLEEAEEDAYGLRKRFPMYHVSQMLGGPSLRRGDTNKGLNIPSNTKCVGKTLVDWYRVNFHCVPIQRPGSP